MNEKTYSLKDKCKNNFVAINPLNAVFTPFLFSEIGLGLCCDCAADEGT
jgi:hypothetical protein